VIKIEDWLLFYPYIAIKHKTVIEQFQTLSFFETLGVCLMVAVDDNTKEQFCGSRLENTKGQNNLLWPTVINDDSEYQVWTS